MIKWDMNNEKCRKCVSVNDYQRGRIPPCEICQMCVHSKEYRKWLGVDNDTNETTT